MRFAGVLVVADGADLDTIVRIGVAVVTAFAATVKEGDSGLKLVLTSDLMAEGESGENGVGLRQIFLPTLIARRVQSRAARFVINRFRKKTSSFFSLPSFSSL